MQNKHIKTYKISLALLVTLLLVACGGGGSSNNSDDTEDVIGSISGSSGTVNTPGTGTCVNFATPQVGDTSLIQNVAIVDDNSVETDIRTTYTAVSNTSRSFDSEVIIGIDGIGTGGSISEDLLPDGIDLEDSLGTIIQTTETFTIANNFINLTRSEATFPATVLSALGVTTTTYSPSLSGPINEVCEGQVFTQDYTETTVSDAGTDSEVVSSINTIEAVNVQQSAPAGTFNTFRVRSESGDAILTTWVDIESSTIVIQEFRNTDGDLLGTSSLISQEL